MIERIARFLTAVSFHRGLALGALVGSAIAGSTIWHRISARGQVVTGERLPDAPDRTIGRTPDSDIP